MTAAVEKEMEEQDVDVEMAWHIEGMTGRGEARA